MKIDPKYATLHEELKKMWHGAVDEHRAWLYRDSIAALEDLSTLKQQLAEQWISVKDRLPEAGELVLTVWCGQVQRITYKLDGDLWICADEDCDPAPMGTFTHWRPLPAPPEGEVYES